MLQLHYRRHCTTSDAYSWHDITLPACICQSIYRTIGIPAGVSSGSGPVNSLKPKFHYADFPETSPWHGHVSGKSPPTWIMLRRSHGDVSGFQTIATCRDGFKNSRDKSVTSPFASQCLQHTGKSATSRTNQRRRHRFVADVTGKSA